MHDLASAANRLDRRIVEDPEMLGKECLSCGKVLAYNFYRRDASYHDGRRDQCLACESAPRLSTAEHVARLKELNYYSEAVKKQRFLDRSEFDNAAAREGRRMSFGEFVIKLCSVVKDLYFQEGMIAGDMSVYRVYGKPQPHLNGRDFEYLWYIPAGVMPEFSIHEFDARDVPIRERERGWRTPLLRLIKAGMLTEAECDRVFGKATGAGSHVWYRELRNSRH